MGVGYEIGLIEALIALVTVIITFTKVIADVGNLKSKCDKHDTLIIENIKGICELQNTTSTIASVETKIDAYFRKMDDLEDKFITKKEFDRYETTVEKTLTEIKDLISKLK